MRDSGLIMSAQIADLQRVDAHTRARRRPHDFR